MIIIFRKKYSVINHILFSLTIIIIFYLFAFPTKSTPNIYINEYGLEVVRKRETFNIYRLC